MLHSWDRQQEKCFICTQPLGFLDELQVSSYSQQQLALRQWNSCQSPWCRAHIWYSICPTNCFMSGKLMTVKSSWRVKVSYRLTVNKDGTKLAELPISLSGPIWCLQTTWWIQAQTRQVPSEPRTGMWGAESFQISREGDGCQWLLDTSALISNS